MGLRCGFAVLRKPWMLAELGCQTMRENRVACLEPTKGAWIGVFELPELGALLMSTVLNRKQFER